jgi:uncharacterized protein YukE
MAMELPEPVIKLLSVIGISFPEVNEDHVRELGSHVRDFAQNVGQTHQDATSTITQMGDAYQGSSYEALVQNWGEMTSRHMTELQDACSVVATAMDAAADFIVGQKVAAIAELVALAVTFIADEAAAAVTFGLSELALPAIYAAARKLCEYLEQQLTQYVIGQVIEAAINPLVGVVEKAVSGFAFQAAQSALGAGGSGGSVGSSFMMQPDQLTAHARVMLDHADTMQQHADTFSSNVSALTFT